jgi:prepilin-type N-terminal cleavage/methylation domain-containing protein
MLTFLRKKGIRLSGFTLIELLVVIAIIGVLASIVLASLNTARRKSRDARRISDLKQIQLALELYFDGNIGNDGAAGPNTGLSYPSSVNLYAANIVSPTYIPTVPLDSRGGQYFYFAFANPPTTYGACLAAGPCLYYHLGADMEEDQVGGVGGNPALAGDSDLVSGTVGDFLGNTPDCVAGANDGCYDVVP